MWNQLLQLTHGLSHQEMNTEWCSYRNSMEHIRKLFKTREMMLLRIKIIALSGYDINGLKIIYGI